MKKMRRAHVLLIDDESESGGALERDLKPHGVDVEWRSPMEVEMRVLARADLVLLDLDFGSAFDERTFVTLSPPDGLAMAGLLRRQPTMLKEHAPPVGFALLSGKVSELAKPFPSTERIPLLSKQHNLEWIFLKSDVTKDAVGIASLAKAIRDIPHSWGEGSHSVRGLMASLGIASASDSDACWSEVEKCHPPIYELTKWTHGLAVIRWLIHKILCYPCFLWDSHYVAARLRVSHPSFLAALKRSSRFRRLLSHTRYEGMLGQFLGDRWWRHRIEALAWSLTRGDSQNSALLRKELFKKAACRFEPSAVEQPLVGLDQNYGLLDETISLDTAIRVQPDDWPPFADAAWMPIEQVAREPALRALVVQEDRDRLTGIRRQ
jgi:hypothetical protein